jgi:hypothetical protein
VPYLRLTADRRGFEHTFLLHVPAPGERPRVLYWYRTAPGLHIGRPALDDAAMRGLESQYPDIDFDWPYILDMGSMTPVEVEAPLPQRRRKVRRPDGEGADDQPSSPAGETAKAPGAPEIDVEPAARTLADGPEAAEDAAPDLLADLLGRGIASGLRDRHRELAARIEASAAGEEARGAWRTRLAAVDPDGWMSPDEVLQGMSVADLEVEVLRGQLDASDASRPEE